MRASLLICSVFVVTFGRQSEANDLVTESLKEVQTEVSQLIEPDVRQEFNSMYNLLTDFSQELSFEEFYSDLRTGKHDNRTCHICTQVISYGKSVLKHADIIKVWAKSFCAKQSTGSTERVCFGTIERMADMIHYILQSTKLNSAEICSVLLHPDCMLHLNQAMTKNVLWEIPLPERKEFKPMNSNLRPLKMLHISDFHLDLWYTPGSNSVCSEPVCCRSTSPAKVNVSQRAAGYWSETNYSCDTPPIFTDTALKQIADRHQDIDFVIWTGDNAPHDSWNSTQESVLLHIKKAAEQVKNVFKEIPVFPSLGNHDTHPSDFYVSSDVPKETNLTMDWLYNTLSDDYWSQWINTESAKKTFKRGGYYSSLVNKGLKVIVLNDGIADKRSYWIAHTSIDPDQQIKWLIEELDESEANGRYAIIIGHYPPSDCYLSWANNYFRIVERYRDVIAGTYFGHTHNDEIIVFHNKNTTTNETYPISVGLIAPSITTYPYYNPGYRVFELDKFGRPLDFSMFYTDIINDNKRGPTVEPEWKLAFSAKKDYGVNDMSPESWDDFITRTQSDDNLMEKYSNNYHRFSQIFIHMNDISIEIKRQISRNRRVVNPIYSLLKSD